MKRIKILHVIRPLGYRGTERNAQALASGVNKSIFEAEVLGTFEGGEREKMLIEDGIKVTLAYGDMECISKTIAESGADIMHLHSHMPQEELNAVLVGVSKAPQMKVVETNVFGKPKEGLAGICDYHGILSASALTRWKQWQSSSYKKKSRNAGVAYYPVDCNVFNAEPSANESRKWLCNEAGIKNDKYILLGAVVTNWKPYMIVNVVTSLLKRRLDHFRLVILGMSDSVRELVRRHNIEEYCEALPVITDDELICRFWNGVDIAVHASSESFGLVLAEAMASGKPVVTISTPMRANAQIELVENGSTGFVAYSGKAVARAIEELVGDIPLRMKMGKAGRERAKVLFARERVIHHWEQIYLSLLPTERLSGIVVPGKLKKHATYSMVEQDISGYSLKRMLNCYGHPNYFSVIGGFVLGYRSVYRFARFMKDKLRILR